MYECYTKLGCMVYTRNSMLTIELMRSSDIGQGVHKLNYECQAIMEFRSCRICN
jgi:hypothetical protein